MEKKSQNFENIIEKACFEKISKVKWIELSWIEWILNV